MQESNPSIKWLDELHFTLNGINFRLIPWGQRDRLSTRKELVIAKPKWVLNRYADCIKELKPDYIVEIGLKQGGSAVFFQQLADASKLVTIEINQQRVKPLDEFIADHELQDSIKPYYGVDQSDSDTVLGIIRKEFNDTPLDLVVDDASHFLEESRISFNTLFPLLRQGGAYVIEDWPWAHDSLTNDDDWQAFWPEKEPLTKLVFELILSLPAVPNMISKVEIDQNSVLIWRGTAPVSRDDFNIESCSLARGRKLIAGNQ